MTERTTFLDVLVLLLILSSFQHCSFYKVCIHNYLLSISVLLTFCCLAWTKFTNLGNFEILIKISSWSKTEVNIQLCIRVQNVQLYIFHMLYVMHMYIYVFVLFFSTQILVYAFSPIYHMYTHSSAKLYIFFTLLPCEWIMKSQPTHFQMVLN